MAEAITVKILRIHYRAYLLLFFFFLFLMALFLSTSYEYNNKWFTLDVLRNIGAIGGTNKSNYRIVTKQTAARNPTGRSTSTNNISATNKNSSKIASSISGSTTSIVQIITSPDVPYYKFMTNLSDGSYYEPYIKIMMNSKDGCQNASLYDAIVAVHSAPTNAEKRKSYRWFYGDFNKTYPYKLKVFFFLGQVFNLTLQNQLVNESQQFGDLVQGSFLDSYKNLTYKAIFTYKWLNDHCHGLRLLLRLDDDVFLGLQHLFHAWDVRVGNKSNSIMCEVVYGDPVFRSGKWPVVKSEITEERYNFNRCYGYFAALSPDLLPKMVEAGSRTRFFWIDDVFFYGFVAKKVGVTFVNVIDIMARRKPQSLETCIRLQGDKCDFIAFLVDVEKFNILYDVIYGNKKKGRKI